jgi:RNA polymerase sigma-B factor
MPTDAPATTFASRSADLDAIAEDYDRRLTGCSGPQAQRLRERMVTDLLPFADRIAGRYRNCGEPAADLAQVARLGLVKAVARYQARRGSFTAYAVLTVDGEIKRYLRDQTWGVRVPRTMQDLAREVRRAEEALTAELRRRPAEAEIAARCGITAGEVRAARVSYAGYRPTPLSTPIGDSGQELGESFGEPDPGIDLVTDRLTARHLVHKLPARERHILDLRFNRGLTQIQIADKLGMSQMHVSRLLNRTLRWLREQMLGNSPSPWPGGDPEPDDGRLRIEVRTLERRAVVVRAAGEVDRDNARQLREVLLEAVGYAGRHRTLTLDLNGVSMLDAAGVSALVAAHESARARGVTVRAVGLSPFARRIAEVTGLGALLTEE